MAVKSGQSTGIVFDLLDGAPQDTRYQIAEFLNTEICIPTGNQLGGISDKTLARDLKILLGPCGFSSGPTDKKSGTAGSRIKAKVMPWGIGDAGHGQWQAALEALKRFVEDRSNEQKMAIGESLVYLGTLAGGSGTVTNNALTALVRWNLDGEHSFDLLNELRYRVSDALRWHGNADLARRLHDSPLPPLHRSPVEMAAAADRVEAQGTPLMAEHIRSLPRTPTWAEMGVKRDLVFRIALRFSEGDVEKAKRLGELAFG